MRALSILFSLEGRIGRSAYWLANLARWALAFGAALIAGAWFQGVVGQVAVGMGASGDDLAGKLQAVSALPDAFRDALPQPFGVTATVATLALAVFVWTGLAIQVKRWHDRGKSGWWFLIGFLPFVGPLWTLVECGCLPARALHSSTQSPRTAATPAP